MGRQDQGIIRDGYNAARPTGGGLGGRKVRPMTSGASNRGAVAGITSAGVVTVYELWGDTRWSADLLSTTSTQHDITFDGVGGIWARSGDGLQLVHTDASGNILTDDVIGSPIASSSGGLPLIDYSAAGLAYCNLLTTPGLVTPAVVAHGPTGDLLGAPSVSSSPDYIGVTTGGRVCGVDAITGYYFVWETDGTLLYSGNAASIATGFTGVPQIAVSPTGNLLHIFANSSFTGTVIRGSVNLATGVLGSNGDTLEPVVTWATCSPAGVLSFGTLPPSGTGTAVKAVAKTEATAYACSTRLEWTYSGGNMVRNDFSVSCSAFDGA